MTSTVSVVTRPETQLVGICVRTSMKNAFVDCARLWHDKFGSRMSEICASGSTESYGVSWTVDLEAGVFDYWAALPASKDSPLPSGMFRTSVPQGTYAYMRAPSLEALSDVYTHIYAAWLPVQKGYEVNIAAPSYELYPADYTTSGFIDVYFPIKAKGDSL